MSKKTYYEKYHKERRKPVGYGSHMKQVHRGKYVPKSRFLCLGKGCKNLAIWQHGDYCSGECRDSIINELRVMNGKPPRDKSTTLL